MEHRVAIGAYRYKIFERIDLVVYLQRRERSFVMHVHKAFTHFSIFGFEVHVTDLANSTKVFEARSASSRVAFICVHRNTARGSFHKPIII